MVEELREVHTEVFLLHFGFYLGMLEREVIQRFAVDEDEVVMPHKGDDKPPKDAQRRSEHAMRSVLNVSNEDSKLFRKVLTS